MKNSPNKQTEETIKTGLTVGVCVQSLHLHDRTIWTGITEIARQNNVNLIGLVGQRLNDPRHFLAQENRIYNLASAKNLDGLIIRSAAIGSYIPRHEIEIFLDRYISLPTVSIGAVVENMPSVVVDNQAGLRNLINHLIVEHGYRHIAFVKGPENHVEAIERFRVYVQALQGHGLSFNPDLIIPGDFSQKAGIEAVKLLFEERRVKVDAIIFANDNMALTALNTLQQLGIQVPDTVAVAGFDDMQESKYALPPLTTVRQPIKELGRRSAELLLAQIEGKDIPQKTELSTELIIRESCGCMLQTVRRAGVEGPAIVLPEIPTGTVKILSPDSRVKVLHKIEEAIQTNGAATTYAQNGVRSTEISLLIDALATDLNDESANAFLSNMSRIARQAISLPNKDPNVWQEVLSEMRRQVLPYLTNSNILIKAENLWHQARVLLGETIKQAQAVRRLQTEQQAQTIHMVNQALISTFDVDQLIDVVVEILPQLEIRSCYICLFDGELKATTGMSTWSRLILAYTDGGRMKISPDNQRFKTRDLIPFTVLPQRRRFNMLVLLLYFRDNPLGYIIFEIETQDSLMFEALRGQISSALQGAMLMRQIQEQKIHLEAEVADRTADLITANEKLQAYATELERSNQELQDFASTASHDLQEPLRKIQTFSHRLQMGYANQLDARGADYLSRMQNATNRMQTLIRDLLAYSRVSTNVKPFSAINLNLVVQGVLSDLETAITAVDGQVNVGDLPTIEADETQMRQLFQNLVSNALKFHKADEPPVITISSELLPEENRCRVLVEDNGIGFDEKHTERVFGMFQRLHGIGKYDGTGMGLAICQKIVKRHNGNIVAKSTPGQGATFIITLPVEQ